MIVDNTEALAVKVTFAPPVPLANTAESVFEIVGTPVGDQLVFVLQVALLAPIHVYVAADDGTALATRITAVAHATNVRASEKYFASLI